MSYKKEDKKCVVPYVKLIILEQNKLYRKIKKLFEHDMILEAINTKKIIDNDNQNTEKITNTLEKILSNTEKAKRYSFEARNISKKNQILLCKIDKTLSKIKCLN